MRALCVFVVVFGCGGKDDAGGSATPAGTGSAQGSAAPSKGSATFGSAAGTGSAGSAVATKPAVKAGKLEYESDPDQFGLNVVFGPRIPRLPAISSDGTLIADFDTDVSGMPMFPMPQHLEILPIAGKAKTETLPLIDVDMAMEEQKNYDSGEWKVGAALGKKLRERGAAAEKRLRDGGFASLHKLDVEDDGQYGANAFKLGTVTLKAKRTDDDQNLVVTLTDAANKAVQKETIKGYQTKESPASFDGGHCSYTPFFSMAYTDAAKRTLYVYVRFRFNEECTAQPITLLSWALPEPPPPPPDQAAVIALASDDLFSDAASRDNKFTTDAQLISGTGIAGPDVKWPWQFKNANEIYSGRDDANLQVVMSGDGKSAWASWTSTLGLLIKNGTGRDAPWRATSVMVKTPAGWRIAASTWTEPVPDPVSERDAKAGKRKAGTFAGDGGDKSLREAFAKLVSAGVDPDATKRGDLVLIGTAPGERTVGGATFAKVWGGGFKGKVTVVSSSAKLAPSGTTGWVAASLELPVKGFKLPFQAFCVFDKTAAGTWSLVHAHFSVY